MLDTSDVRLVAGDADAGFWRPDTAPPAGAPVLEGYRWGGLTSRHERGGCVGVARAVRGRQRGGGDAPARRCAARSSPRNCARARSRDRPPVRTVAHDHDDPFRLRHRGRRSGLAMRQQQRVRRHAHRTTRFLHVALARHARTHRHRRARATALAARLVVRGPPFVAAVRSVPARSVERTSPAHAVRRSALLGRPRTHRDATASAHRDAARADESAARRHHLRGAPRGTAAAPATIVIALSAVVLATAAVLTTRTTTSTLRQAGRDRARVHGRAVPGCARARVVHEARRHRPPPGARHHDRSHDVVRGPGDDAAPLGGFGLLGRRKEKAPVALWGCGTTCLALRVRRSGSVPGFRRVL